MQLVHFAALIAARADSAFATGGGAPGAEGAHRAMVIPREMGMASWDMNPIMWNGTRAAQP